MVSALALTCALLASDRPQGFQDHIVGTALASVPHSTQPQGTGIACGDFDGDGDPDLVIAGDPGQPLWLFRNDSAFVFSDQTAGAGLGVAPAVRGMAVADIDNDGDVDLFVCVWRSPSLLFVNDGQGHFVEQAAARGITQVASSYCATFGDYDRDGWIDLFVGNHVGPGNSAEAAILYHNSGNGAFTDATAPAGVGDLGHTYAATFVDFDDDGWPDLATANDQGLRNRPNNLYRNNGDGTFTSVAAAVGAQWAIDGMGIDFADAFADGGVDLVYSNTPPDHLFLVWNPATGGYADGTFTYGMVDLTISAWAIHFLDYDNDGWIDVHAVHVLAPNHLYRNPGQPASAHVPWPEVANSVGLGHNYEQYVTAIADLDGDGGLDFVHRFAAAPAQQAPFAVALLRNAVPRGNWLEFRTRGSVSNRDGIGARLSLWTGGHRQRQWVRSGPGFMSSSDLRVHFGLGSATQADVVEIAWPSGQVHYLTNVPANRIVSVDEPHMELRAPAFPGATTHLDVSIGSDAGLIYVMALAFSNQPPTPLPGKLLPLQVDALTLLSIEPGNLLLPGCVGVLDGQGRGSSPLWIPPLAGLTGLRFFATAVTLDPPIFPFRTVFPRAVAITIQ